MGDPKIHPLPADHKRRSSETVQTLRSFFLWRSAGSGIPDWSDRKLRGTSGMESVFRQWDLLSGRTGKRIRLPQNQQISCSLWHGKTSLDERRIHEEDGRWQILWDGSAVSERSDHKRSGLPQDRCYGKNKNRSISGYQRSGGFLWKGTGIWDIHVCA